MARRLPEGISLRHQRACPSREGNACRCKPTYQAQAWSPRDRKRLTRTFPTLAAAKGWRHDAIAGLRSGTLVLGGGATFAQVADEWLTAAKAGLIRNRSGDEYKPSALRGYGQALDSRLKPALGARKLSDIRRSDVQRLVNQLLREGLDPSTVRNALMPLRAIYRYALALEEVAVNPTQGIHLPAVRGRRMRIASREEATALVAALRPDDRALYATALYAGFRVGELLALRWEDVDLDANLLRVERAYDPKAREMIEPKSRAGRRKVPMPKLLRAHFLEHQLRQGRRAGLVFGRDADQPFSYGAQIERSERAWKRAELDRIGLHECRHTFASLMIAAGVNAKALATFMGHSSVTITLDRYGHLMPGSEEEAAGMLDRYLAGAG